jgi:NAD(P)-dependent dehydrogenase (short-subunit alcohol dehydrogenase family)
MGRVDEKVALISGAARGMGASHARLLVAEGAKVVIGDILDDQGPPTQHGSAHGRATTASSTARNGPSSTTSRRIKRKIAVGCSADPISSEQARKLATALIAAADAADEPEG